MLNYVSPILHDNKYVILSLLWLYKVESMEHTVRMKLTSQLFI